MKRSHLTLGAAILALGGYSGASAEAQSGSVAATSTTDAEIVKMAGAPLFDGMGNYSRKISTSSAAANRYFNQGMVLAFGFNHAESIRSFRAAQRLDPGCAMCFWGEALATGPNINVTSKGKAVMSEADRKSAFAAINRALALKGTATPVEQALIEAQAKRYNGDPSTAREPLDLAYAEAMEKFVAAHPDDDDAAAIYAEALMNTMPWDYWSADGKAKPETEKVIATLERIIARSPKHPLALHLYIHAVEASDQPGRAEDEADALANLVPGSGHLVHMPAHIFWRVGRYDDAAKANVRAASVDEEYIAACNAQGFYPALYYPHNIHFLWAATSMSGQSKMALESARKVAANVRLEQIEQFPTVEFFKTIPLQTLAQFGKWPDIMAEPAPPGNLDYSNAIWRYARGLAMANMGNIDVAQTERAKLAAVKDSVQIRFLDSADYPASVLLNIADDLLQGEIALKSGDPDLAASHFQRAVEKQDSLPYMEPPFWYYPTRQSLGQALLDGGRFAEAEAVYRKDLEDYPHNGWSMSGLAAALERQGKMDEANKAKAALAIIWAKADVKINGSRL
ncbi:tetratricopeptide repeat protein [uncultured Parasphingorhabdus sp.]|uniref:tetratricopeptide repeat protein n=1 Tax=uncultured Parasphingorhabdus sp. TaxID=2709694 RepID=UPI0030D78CCD|tara:strand:- start:99221 stop:100924 length:1704 start_codon:yes stop_codon:yes gene_type:complete